MNKTTKKTRKEQSMKKSRMRKQTNKLNGMAAALIAAGMMTGTVNAQAAGTPPSHPFKDAVKVWHFADDSGLKAEGAAMTGVKLEGDEKAASLARGGDGMVATLEGGHFLTQGDLQVTGKQMTLLIRARDPQGAWSGALLARITPDDPFFNLLFASKLDLTRLGYRERQRMSDGRAITFRWRSDPLVDKVIDAYKGEDSPYWTKPGRLQNVRFKMPRNEGYLEVAMPVELTGPDAWHDILVRFDGPKLDLFVDGVLIDEEYPHGELRHFVEPFLVGAGIEKGKVTSGFQGQIDHMAVWDRGLTDAEIATLSGGAKTADRRSVEILGEEGAIPQYWRPAGYNAFVGDPMLFTHDGRLHFMYLFDRKHSRQKWNVGAHPWGHLSTTDLKNWEHHPRAIDLTEPYEHALGTGQCIVHDGTYYLYWLDHGRRMPFKDSPEHFHADNIYVATSTDGIHFTKHLDKPWVRVDYKTGADINPVVWKAAKGDRFLMYQANRTTPRGPNWYFESKDLKTWTPTQIPALDPVRTICVTYREWGGRYYWFGGDGIWVSEKPVEEPGAKLDRLPSLEEAWVVPQAAPFGEDRMIMCGFSAPAMPPYASDALFRELVRFEDGTLGSKWVPEMVPAAGKPLNPALEPLRGKVSGKADALRVAAEGSTPGIAFCEKLPDNLLIRLRVNPGSGASGFGVAVRGQGDFQSGKELCFEPEAKSFRYAWAPDSKPVPQVNKFTPTSQTNIGRLDQPFDLEIIVKNDFVDVCIDGRRTLYHRRDEDYNQGDRLFFFVRQGEVVFENIEIRPLSDDWKLVVNYKTKTLELYNLREDLGETKDLAAQHPERVREMLKLIQDHFTATGGSIRSNIWNAVKPNYNP